MATVIPISESKHLDTVGEIKERKVFLKKEMNGIWPHCVLESNQDGEFWRVCEMRNASNPAGSCGKIGFLVGLLRGFYRE